LKLELRGLAVCHPAARAGALALQPLNLQVAAGEQLAVIGPSGAGKTTLLQAMACALPPRSGMLQLDGQDPWALPRRDLQRLRGRLFLAPQVPPLPPRQRVVTSVLAGRLPAMGLLASLRSLFYPQDIPAAYDALQRFDLDDKLFERVDRLSGGERQRVGLARALLAPASLWLVDEPLSALDPTRAQQALATLLQQRANAASRWWPRCTRWTRRWRTFRASSACAKACWSLTCPPPKSTATGWPGCMASTSSSCKPTPPRKPKSSHRSRPHQW